jgi:hypothetical protein
MRISLVLRLAPLAALAAAGAVPPLVAADTVPGDRWEITSQMSMEGMPMAMPTNKVKVCTPKTWTQPPTAAEDQMHCTNSDFAIDGDKATWKVTCAGPPAMTGEGEIIRDGEDTWSGTIKFSSSEGAMSMKISGKKLADCQAQP